ncbi:hypothetical protein BDF20DRAFT_841867 [Mycotypha africana]|uniref:uncharacterized protein n=1 Tax=Mycotypha africana TaxID=64632 RepID=UPI002301B100|nr:uncharacterized protein BDF20DRAFT_841867 [Mycotypha africana]KAI8990960.1 hypothetical protein BDF20DRAFT_841867 [Mycotypha africana]
MFVSAFFGTLPNDKDVSFFSRVLLSKLDYNEGVLLNENKIPSFPYFAFFVTYSSIHVQKFLYTED